MTDDLLMAIGGVLLLTGAYVIAPGLAVMVLGAGVLAVGLTRARRKRQY